MKMQKIQITNYRSLRDVTILPNDIIALVGQNNSGKSNVIKALELFFAASTKFVDEECFYKSNDKESLESKTEEPIEILITFEKLSGWEKEKFGPWMDDDKLTVGREVVCTNDSYSINHIAITNVPTPKWLRDDEINGNNINEWWNTKDKLKLNELDFAATLGTSKPGVAKWKEIAKQFVETHHDQIPRKETRVKNPTGLKAALKDILPEFIHIPAVRDVSDETKITKTNPFGQLMNSILEKIPEGEKSSLSQQLKEIEKRLNRSEEGRISGIQAIENRFNELMRPSTNPFSTVTL